MQVRMGSENCAYTHGVLNGQHLTDVRIRIVRVTEDKRIVAAGLDTSRLLADRERIRPREDGWSAFYGSFEKKLFQKNFRKHLVVTIKSLTFASAFGNDGKQE